LPASSQESKTAQRRKLATALSLGYNLAAGVAIFTLFGYFIDRRRGGGQFWTLVGIFMGLLYGAYEVWKVVREIEQNEPERNENKQDPAS